MKDISEMTEANLRSAFSGESQARMRYKVYSEVAQNEGFQNISRLFEAIAYAERVHATNHLRRTAELAGQAVAESPYGVGDTLDNIRKGIDGEAFEIEEMYPAYLRVAELQNEGAARQSFEWALEAEKTHLEMYIDAEEFLEKDEDPKLGKIRVCNVCGYTTEGEVEEVCPICGSKENYTIFD